MSKIKRILYTAMATTSIIYCAYTGMLFIMLSVSKNSGFRLYIFSSSIISLICVSLSIILFVKKVDSQLITIVTEKAQPKEKAWQFKGGFLATLSSIAMLFCVYIASFPTTKAFSSIAFLIISLLCLTLAIILIFKIYDTEVSGTGRRLELLVIYLTLFIINSIQGSFFIPQPGGIELTNRLLSPFMGPWSRFLKPNALTFERCSSGFLIFSYSISTLMIIFIPLSFFVKPRIFRYICIAIGLLTTLGWIGYGLFRILLDLR